MGGIKQAVRKCLFCAQGGHFQFKIFEDLRVVYPGQIFEDHAIFIAIGIIKTFVGCGARHRVFDVR